jgi:hypothetical protein
MTSSSKPEKLFSLTVNSHEVMLLGAGLTASLKQFAAHRLNEDPEGFHTEKQWDEFRTRVGQLLWKLETVGASPGTVSEYSAEAVPPD